MNGWQSGAGGGKEQDDELFSALPERKGGVKVTINPDDVPGTGVKKNPPEFSGGF